MMSTPEWRAKNAERLREYRRRWRRENRERVNAGKRRARARRKGMDEPIHEEPAQEPRDTYDPRTDTTDEQVQFHVTWGSGKKATVTGRLAGTTLELRFAGCVPEIDLQAAVTAATREVFMRGSETVVWSNEDVLNYGRKPCRST